MSKPVYVSLAIRLSDGSFNAELKMPLKLGTTVAECNKYIERWLGLTQAALAEGVLSLDAELTPEPKT